MSVSERQSSTILVMTQRAVANAQEPTIEEIVGLAVASLAEVPAEDLDLLTQKLREPGGSADSSSE